MNEPSSLPAIETLLPHQAPMLLLDRLCAADAQQARCRPASVPVMPCCWMARATCPAGSASS